jgi:hypothetical protein
VTHPYRTPCPPPERRDAWWRGLRVTLAHLPAWLAGVELTEYRWYRQELGGRWERAVPAMGPPLAWQRPSGVAHRPWRESFVDWEREEWA